MTRWEVDWPSIKSILFGGSTALLVHFLWDGWWKPGIEGRELANTIRVEITLLFKALLLGREFMLSHPAGLPNGPFNLDSVIYESLASRIGHLPPKIAEDLVGFYKLVRDINHTMSVHGPRFGMLYHAPRPLPPEVQEQEDILLRVLRGQIDMGMQVSDRLRHKLYDFGNPRWTPNRWFGEKPETITRADVQKWIRDTDVRRDIIDTIVGKRAPE